MVPSWSTRCRTSTEGRQRRFDLRTEFGAVRWDDVAVAQLRRGQDGRGFAGADSLTNGLPSAEGSSTLATVSAGSMLSCAPRV